MATVQGQGLKGAAAAEGEGQPDGGLWGMGTGAGGLELAAGTGGSMALDA